MKRFLVILISILGISGAAFYMLSLPHAWMTDAFRFTLYAMILGCILTMALYHVFLYMFAENDRAYGIFSAVTLLATARFITIPGGLAAIIAPEYTAPLRHISESTLPLFYIFGMWFSHTVLRLPWGGALTRTIYIVTLGLPLALTLAAGKAAGTWWGLMAGIPHIFIIIKGLASRRCRANPYALLFIGMEFLAFFAAPFLMLTGIQQTLYMPYLPFWLLFALVQAALLSHSHGETKRREKELADEKALLESLNRTKSEFFSNISHEMKTPLTIVSTDIQLAEQFMEAGKIGEAKKLLREAWRETMQAANLVSDALTFARGQETAKPMDRFDFGALIAATLVTFEPLIKKRGNALTRDIAPLPPVDGNADMLAGALVNLLSNANRHTRDGAIHVQWAMDGERRQLKVIDAGSGIAPEIIPRLFERGSTGGNGTGLGLALVKKVMELHGGDVAVESEAGRGTTVTLAFPAAKEQYDRENDTFGRRQPQSHAE